MDHIYTPWRRDYMQSSKKSGCIFCHALEASDQESLIIVRGKLSFIILNRYPYTNGHLMVVPYQHASTLEELDADTRCEMMELLNTSLVVLKGVYHPDGFNLGGNIGEAAGAGVADHIHLHVLPRWMGDTNFMTSVSGTRILPETVEESWRRIRDAWK